jgi:hypothetical protein
MNKEETKSNVRLCMYKIKCQDICSSKDSVVTDNSVFAVLLGLELDPEVRSLLSSSI